MVTTSRDHPRVSRRRHEQSEPGLRELPRAQIHGRLTRPLEAAETLVLHHADDLECFWCSGAARHSRSGTVYPAADDCSVHVDERFVHDGYTGSTPTVVIGKRAARQDLDTEGVEVTWADYAQLRLSADLALGASCRALHSERISPVRLEGMVIGERHSADIRAALERLPDAIFEGDDPRRSVERSWQTDVRRHHAVNEESRIFRRHGPQ